MNKIKNYIIGLVFLLCSINSYAQEIQKNNISIHQEMEKDLKTKLEFLRLVMRSADRIDLKIESEKISPNAGVDDRKLVMLLREELEAMVSFYAQELLIPEPQVMRLKNTYKWMNLDKVIEVYHRSKIGLEIFFKRKGIGIGLAVLAGVFSELTIPVILTQLGLVQYIPISMLTPYALIYSFIPSMIHQWKINQAIRNNLADKRDFDVYKEQVKYFKRELIQANYFDLLIPITSINEDNVVGIKSKNFLAKLYELMGMDSQSLNVKNLKKFILEQKMNNEFIVSILNHKNLEKSVQLALVINYIFENGSSDQIILFKSHFKINMINLKIKKYYNELIKWTIDAGKVSDPEKLYDLIKLLPQETSVDEFLVLYEEIIIPNQLNYFEINFGDARKYMSDFELLKGKLLVLSKNTPVENFHQDVFDFVGKAFGVKRNECYNTPGQVLHYLKSSYQ